MRANKEAELIHEFLIAVDRLFGADPIETLARQSGFVQRQSPLTGHLFLTAFVFGVSLYASPTLEQLCGLLHTAESPLKLSRQSMDERINARAVEFFEQLLSRVCQLQLPSAFSSEWFQQFTRVILLDSTGFQLPEHLADLFPGFGGNASAAGLKIQFGYDLKSGRFFTVCKALCVPTMLQRMLFWSTSNPGSYGLLI